MKHFSIENYCVSPQPIGWERSGNRIHLNCLPLRSLSLHSCFPHSMPLQLLPCAGIEKKRQYTEAHTTISHIDASLFPFLSFFQNGPIIHIRIWQIGRIYLAENFDRHPSNSFHTLIWLFANRHKFSMEILIFLKKIRNYYWVKRSIFFEGNHTFFKISSGSIFGPKRHCTRDAAGRKKKEFRERKSPIFWKFYKFKKFFSNFFPFFLLFVFFWIRHQFSSKMKNATNLNRIK